MPFDGPVILFGAMVEYHPISAKDHQDCISLEQKSCQVYFSVMHCTQGESGKEIIVADIEELEEIDTSELYASGLNAKEVLLPMKGDNFSRSQMEQSKYLEEMSI